MPPTSFSYQPTAAERATVWVAAAVALVLVGVFSGFFVIGVNLPLFSLQHILSVGLASALLFYVLAYLTLWRFLATVRLSAEGIGVEFPYRVLGRKLHYGTRGLTAAALVPGEHKAWELGLFSEREGRKHYLRLYIPEDFPGALAKWARATGTPLAATHPEYEALLARLGLSHDLP